MSRSVKSGAIIGPMRVLIVEDEALVAMEIEAMIAMAGHIVVGQADDLSSTLAAIEREKPDFALVDIRLAQGCSGIDVAAALRARGIPVVFATGNRPAKDRFDVALGCVQKPITDRGLASVLSVVEAVMHGGILPPLHPSIHLYHG